MFSRRNRPIFPRLLLAAALLVAQSGAIAHEYAHRASDLAGAPAPQLCDECLCYAPLTSPAAGSIHAVFVPRADIGRVTLPQRVGTLDARPLAAFRSRAPPAPLV